MYSKIGNKINSKQLYCYIWSRILWAVFWILFSFPFIEKLSSRIIVCSTVSPEFCRLNIPLITGRVIINTINSIIMVLRIRRRICSICSFWMDSFSNSFKNLRVLKSIVIRFRRFKRWIISGMAVKGRSQRKNGVKNKFTELHYSKVQYESSYYRDKQIIIKSGSWK